MIWIIRVLQVCVAKCAKEILDRLPPITAVGITDARQGSDHGGVRRITGRCGELDALGGNGAGSIAKRCDKTFFEQVDFCFIQLKTRPSQP